MSRARSNKRRREHENDEGATTDRIQEDCSGPHTISGGSHFLCWVCYSDELLELAGPGGLELLSPDRRRQMK
jgi:hypothetical protein